jgi:hypothetical protein
MSRIIFGQRKRLRKLIQSLLIETLSAVYNFVMIDTFDGETFTIRTRKGTLELTRDELEAVILEGEILLEELREFYFEPDTSE